MRKERRLWFHGNSSLLDERLSALLCSNRCPGEKILQGMDLAQKWRSENRAVISGFHTPVEKECLRTFLRDRNISSLCPARGLDPFQLPPEWQTKFDRHELLIVSSFDSSIRRPTKETAAVRTGVVLDFATECTIIYANPGGLLDRLSKSAQVETIDSRR